MMQHTQGILHVVNLTHEQPNPPRNDPPEHKIVRGKKPELDRVFNRPVNTIDGIVIHQTGSPFGVTAAAIKASKGDAVLAKHRRALGIAAHMTAFDTGYAVLAHPLEWYVYHGNGLNARSLGLEVEGLYPGKMTKPLLTDKLLQAACDGLTYLVKQGRAAGMPIKFIWAHRQSSLTRPNDPGEEIWRKVVLDFAIGNLGLAPQSDYVNGGETIPAHWKSIKGVG